MLAENLTTDTGMSIGLLLGLAGLLGGGLVVAIASRVTHGIMIKHLRDDVDGLLKLVEVLKDKNTTLEREAAVRDARHDFARQIADAIGNAVGEAIASASGVFSPKRGGGG